MAAPARHLAHLPDLTNLTMTHHTPKKTHPKKKNLQNHHKPASRP